MSTTVASPHGSNKSYKSGDIGKPCYTCNMARRADKEAYLDELIARDPLLPAQRYHDALRSRFGRGIPLQVIYDRLRSCGAVRNRATITRSTGQVDERRARKLEVLGELVRDHPVESMRWYRDRLLEHCSGALSRNEMFAEIRRLRHASA